jgi:hypothetical protein
MAGAPSSKVLSWSARARRVAASAVEIYGRFDHRSLGLARIYMGLLFLHDLVRRLPDISVWYSNDGILPNHTVLWRPHSEYMFSFFFAASRTDEAAVMFVLCAAVFVAFTIGYRTRLTHALSFACLVSMAYRQAFLENGGDIALKVLCAWTLFLPMGARFSVDALRESLAARRERTVTELDVPPALPDPKKHGAASIAFFALLLQLAVIYYFNAANKRGWTWRQGSAVHYCLYQERMITWFSYLVRDHIPLRVSRFLSHGTLAMEYSTPLLLLTPVGYVRTRRIAIVLLTLMHLGFAACLNLGQFSFNMIGFYPLLLSAQDWDYLAARFGSSPKRARRVLVRESSPIAFSFARLLSRLDSFRRLTFVPASDEPGAGAWEVEDVSRSPPVRMRGTRAVAQCIAALPGGSLVAWLLRFGPVAGIGDGILRMLAKRERTIARWFRLLPAGALAPRRVERSNHPPTPARVFLRRRLANLRELSVVVLLVCCATQLFVENNAIPQRLKPHQPRWMTQVVWYGRLTQGWQMFSPDAPTGERQLYVDAVTFSGRHVDPLNEVASRVANLPVEQIPPHLEQDEWWHDYIRGIPEAEAYWRALKEWIFNYHNRTGRPEDRVISFEARLIETDNPPPGEKGQRNIRTKVMLSARE